MLILIFLSDWLNKVFFLLLCRRYCDGVALTYQAERMPEPIRLKVGGVTPQQMAVYEEFARNIPGFLPLTERDTALFIPKPTVALEPQHPSTPFQVPQSALASDDMAVLYEKLAVEVDQFVQATAGQAAYTVINTNLTLLRDALVTAIHNRELVSAVPIVQRVSYI